MEKIDWGKGVRLNKKYEYNLLSRNCTTITNVGILPVTSPSGLNSYLNDRRIAEETGTIKIMDSPFSREPIKIERKIIKKVIKHNKKK